MLRAPMEERIGIVGSGAIATGIAKAAADHGDVVLWARSDESADRVRNRVDTQVLTELDALADRTIIIEAVVEDHAAKAGLYAMLPLADDAILASTTSSLSVTQLARDSGHPERFGALHFFNPVHRMELVELAFPPEATDETRARIASFGRLRSHESADFCLAGTPQRHAHYARSDRAAGDADGNRRDVAVTATHRTSHLEIRGWRQGHQTGFS